jgi:hypothetical protein
MRRLPVLDRDGQRLTDDAILLNVSAGP